MMNKQDLSDVIDKLEWCVRQCKEAEVIAYNKDITSDEALRDAIDALSRHMARPEGSILSELVIHEIEAALKRNDVDIKRNALRAYREMSSVCDIDSEIPF